VSVSVASYCSARVVAIPTGLEPVLTRLEGECFIH